MNTLRPYQVELVEAVRQAYREGYRSPCIVAPCGAGKSVVVAELARRTTEKGNRVLYLIHRKELCEQIERTFDAWGVNRERSQICMVQTAARRLDKLAPPALIITDENHHALAATYRKIYDAFPEARRVGVTATPVRLGGGGLGDVNDKLVCGVGAKWLIEHGYLAPYDYYAPSVADLTGLKVTAGEYMISDIEARLNKPAIWGDVIGYYRKLGEGRKAVCYCASVASSERMAQAFCSAGIPARHIDGATAPAERDRTIEAFRTGEVRILCNVDLISEGFDVPDCGASILLRPTKSLSLYIQQAMRCMRYQPGKRAVILDHVGNYARFGLPDMERTWSLEPKPKGRGRAKDAAVPAVQQCPHCFFTHEPAPACPHCGFVYPRQRVIEERREAAITRIEPLVLDYRSPAGCSSFAELAAFGKRQGYKPGWAFYQAKARGLL